MSVPRLLAGIVVAVYSILYFSYVVEEFVTVWDYSSPKHS